MLHLSSLKNIAKNSPPGPRKWKVQTSNVQFMQIILYKTEVPLFRGVNLSDFLEEKTMGDQTPRAHDSPHREPRYNFTQGLSWAPPSPTSLKGLVQEINFNQFIGVLLVHYTHLSFVFIYHLSAVTFTTFSVHRSAVPLRGTVATGDHLFSGPLGPEKPRCMMWCRFQGCLTWGTAMQYDIYIYWYIM